VPKIDFIEVFCFCFICFLLTVQHHDNKKEAAGVKQGVCEQESTAPVMVEITAEEGSGRGDLHLFG